MKRRLINLEDNFYGLGLAGKLRVTPELREEKILNRRMTQKRTSMIVH